MSYNTNLQKAKEASLSELTNITDATYENDPNGTECNKAYHMINVHTYLKDLAKAVYPSQTKYVNPDFDGIGSPYFANVSDAIDSFAVIGNGASSNNMGTIQVLPAGSSYTDNIAISHNLILNIKGQSLFSTFITGEIAISAGTIIFEDITFTNNILVSKGATVIFKNCRQTSGTTRLSGATLFISYASEWGAMSVDGTENVFYCFYVQDIAKNDNMSVTIKENTTGSFDMKYCELEGGIEAGIVVNKTSVNENQPPIPKI